MLTAVIFLVKNLRRENFKGSVAGLGSPQTSQWQLLPSCLLRADETLTERDLLRSVCDVDLKPAANVSGVVYRCEERWIGVVSTRHRGNTSTSLLVVTFSRRHEGLLHDCSDTMIFSSTAVTTTTRVSTNLVEVINRPFAVSLPASGYPDPPNFCPPPKIRRKKCYRRKRRRILESQSAAEKNPAKIWLNSQNRPTHILELHKPKIFQSAEI